MRHRNFVFIQVNSLYLEFVANCEAEWKATGTMNTMNKLRVLRCVLCSEAQTPILKVTYDKACSQKGDPQHGTPADNALHLP